MNRVTGIGRGEHLARKSRFIAVAGPLHEPGSAERFIARHGVSGCRHVCWAWRCGEQVRYDDAGEPGGTAGRPILAALDSFELDRSIVVVSRHFGGIKLGTGGLARAYRTAAAEALARASIEPLVETRRLVCEVPFEAAGEVHQLAERHGAEKQTDRWRPSGLRLELEIPRNAADAFIKELTAVTRGTGTVKKVVPD